MTRSQMSAARVLHAASGLMFCAPLEEIPEDERDATQRWSGSAQAVAKSIRRGRRHPGLSVR